ncbi:MAG: DUF58 domain-containing protein [Anaerolineae bacterium]
MKQETTSRLTMPSRTPLALIALLLALQLVTPSVVWTILLVGLAITLGLSFAWLHRLATDVSLTRRQRGAWVVAGDALEEMWELVNRGALPVLAAEIVDHSTLPAYTANRVMAAGPSAITAWRTTAICQQRGLFTLGPWDVIMSDPFGLFTLTQHYALTQSILVYPRVVSLPPLELPRGGASGRARATRKALESDLTVASVRPWAPGDSLRRVAWGITAHRDALMVREFDQEPAGNLWIVADLDAAVQVGQGLDGTEEFAIVLAASLAAHWLRRNRAVGIVAFGREPLLLPPQRGEAQLWRILHSLAASDTSPAWPLARTLTAIRSSLGHGITLAVITPTTQADWLPAFLLLQARGVAPAAILLDAASFAEPPAPTPGAATLALRAILVRQGITTHLLDRHLARRPLITYRRTRTDLRTLATGRVISRDVVEEV